MTFDLRSAVHDPDTYTTGLRLGLEGVRGKLNHLQYRPIHFEDMHLFRERNITTSVV